MNETRAFVTAALLVACGAACFRAAGKAPPDTGRQRGESAKGEPAVVCTGDAVRDQDDMCIWIHPTDRGKSTVITSDKAANRLFVYDLSGKILQTVAARGPGNIDLRYGFPLAGKRVDIVALNQRAGGYRIAAFKVDHATRRLLRIDNGRIATAENYGGTLFRSRKTGKFYFITTSRAGTVEQYELADDGEGKVKGTKVRTWKAGYSEGAVGDDIGGKIYIGQENRGVWEIGAEPTDPAPGKLILRIGDHGLKADVEGLTIYRLAGGRKGYLIVSNQGRDNFKVFRLSGRHEYVGTFTIAGARDSDGIDVANVNLGGRFAKGLFACHSNRKRGGGCPVLLTAWDDIARSMKPPLAIDTSWDPRK